VVSPMAVATGVGVVSGPPFDPTNPSAEPPPGCRHPQRWQRSYELFRRHRVVRQGRCSCGERVPCAMRALAVRGLLDAYLMQEDTAERGDGPGGRTGACRWCGQPVDRHAVWGWLHREPAAGLYLCRHPYPGSPPLCGAEPGVETGRLR
jgi:hypothetical protein